MKKCYLLSRSLFALSLLAINQPVTAQTPDAASSANAAYQQKDWAIVQIKVDPIFDSLRSDARFSDLLKRMNLQ